MVGREAVLPYSPAEGLLGCGAELAQGLSYLEVGIGSSSVAGLRRMPRFRSAPLSFCIVLDGQREVGQALPLSATPRGNGVGTLSYSVLGNL